MVDDYEESEDEEVEENLDAPPMHDPSYNQAIGGAINYVPLGENREISFAYITFNDYDCLPGYA